MQADVNTPDDDLGGVSLMNSMLMEAGMDRDQLEFESLFVVENDSMRVMTYDPKRNQNDINASATDFNDVFTLKEFDDCELLSCPKFIIDCENKSRYGQNSYPLSSGSATSTLFLDLGWLLERCEYDYFFTCKILILFQEQGVYHISKLLESTMNKNAKATSFHTV